MITQMIPELLVRAGANAAASAVLQNEYWFVAGKFEYIMNVRFTVQVSNHDQFSITKRSANRLMCYKVTKPV